MRVFDAEKVGLSYYLWGRRLQLQLLMILVQLQLLEECRLISHTTDQIIQKVMAVNRWKPICMTCFSDSISSINQVCY